MPLADSCPRPGKEVLTRPWHGGSPKVSTRRYAVVMYAPSHSHLLLLLGLGCHPPGVINPPDTGPDTTVPDDTDEDTGPEDTGPEDTATEQIPDGPLVYDGDALFNEDTIPELAITLNASAIQSLRQDPYEWVEGSFTWEDEHFERVAIRIKGISSYRSIDDKPSLKIKLDEFVEDQRLDGLSQITINNMIQDASMMHERVGYHMFRAAGVPARRAHHAHLTLNDEDYGLYVHTEASTRKMVEPWYNKEGTLWEFSDSELDSTYIHLMEAEFGDDDMSKLQEAAALLATSNTIDMDTIQDAIDIELFERYWALCAITSNYDGHPYRYPADDAYMYHDPDSDQLKFMPHGIDEGFYYPDHDFTSGVVSIVGYKCLDTTSCYEGTVDKIFEALDVLESDEVGLLEWFDGVQAQIQPYVQSDPRQEFSAHQIQYYQTEMRELIENRRAVLEAMTGRGG